MRYLTFVVLAFWPTLAFAAEVRVQPGDDVQAALDQAMPGDVVILEQGSHAGPVQTVREGSADAPITLRGERAATPR